MQIAGMESLRPDFFINGSLETFTRVIEGDALYLFGELPNEVFFTNSHQLASHIAQAVDNIQTMNKHYPVQGMKSYLFQKAAEISAKAMSLKISVKTVPLEVLDEMG